jgi:hypothetical protein
MDKDVYQHAIELALDWLCSQSDNTQALAAWDEVYQTAYERINPAVFVDLEFDEFEL